MWTIVFPFGCANGNYFLSQEEAHSTQITFYDQNPILNSEAKSVSVKYEIATTINVNSSYPQDLKSGYAPTEWKYVDIDNKNSSLPKNVTVVSGKVEDVYITQRPLSFYAEGWTEIKSPSEPEEPTCDHNNWTWIGGAKPYKCKTCGSTKAELKPAEVEKYLANCAAAEMTTATTIVNTDNDGVATIGNAIKNSTMNVDLELKGGVTSIGKFAFKNCKKLTSVTIENGVESIGEDAFFQCWALASVAIPGSVKSIGKFAFADCNMTSVNIPNGVESIGEAAFFQCRALASVTISSSVTYIGLGAFAGCSSLISVTFADTKNWYRGSNPIDVSDPTTNANKIKSYDYYTGWAGSPLTKKLGNDEDIDYILASELHQYLIDHADKVIVKVKTDNEDDVRTMEEAMKATDINATGLDLVIAGDITEIYKYAFENCTLLTSVEIPDTLTDLGYYPFEGCTSLASIIVSDSHPTYSSEGGVLYNKDKSTLVRYPPAKTGASYTIQAGVTSIESGAFEGCTSLASVTFEDKSNWWTSYNKESYDNPINVDDAVTNAVNLAKWEYNSSTYQNEGWAGYYLNKNIHVWTWNAGTRLYTCSHCGESKPALAPGEIVPYLVSCGTGTATVVAKVTEETNTSGSIYNDTQTIGRALKNSNVNVSGIDLEFEGEFTKISNYAFRDCTKITSVIIPEGVTSIESGAFSGCTSLTSVTFEDTSNWWTSYNKESYDNPINVDDAVTNAVNLAKWEYNSSTYQNEGWAGYYLNKNIHVWTWNAGTRLYTCSHCSESKPSLEAGEIVPYLVSCGTGTATVVAKVTEETNTSGSIYNDTQTIGRALKNSNVNVSGIDLEFEGEFTKISNYAFRDCTKITSVIIPEGVTSIGNSAFSNCSGLTGSLNIPEGVTSIGEYTFYYCSGLTGTLTIPSSVTSIGERAFYSCSGLTGSLNIPEGVTSIGEEAFAHCSGLTGSLNIPEGVTSIGNGAFSNCSGLTGSLNIPEGVTSIGEYTFYYCSGLTGTLTIPSSVTSIGDFAFTNCSGLTSVTISEGVTSIGYDAFSLCSGLTSVEIPTSVTEIGVGAFLACDLKEIVFKDTTRWYADTEPINVSNAETNAYNMNYSDRLWGEKYLHKDTTP